MSGTPQNENPLLAYYVGVGVYPDRLHRVEAVNPRQAALIVAAGGAPLNDGDDVRWGRKKAIRVYELLDMETGKLSEPHVYEAVVRIEDHDEPSAATSR